MVAISLRETYPNTKLFPVRIFLYSDTIRRFNPQISVFSPNTRKYGQEIAPYLCLSLYDLYLIISPKIMQIEENQEEDQGTGEFEHSIMKMEEFPSLQLLRKIKSKIDVMGSKGNFSLY